MHKVVWLVAVPGGLGLASGRVVYAASEEKQDSVSLRTEELSLYTTPQDKYKYLEPEASQLEQGISVLRKSAEPYTTWCQQTGQTTVEKAQEAYMAAKPRFEGSVQFGKEGYEFLRDPPPGFYPRVGVIGFAGILGLFLARGSKIKKLVYPTGLMALGASLYYPQQAVTVAKVTGDTLYDWSLWGYLAVESLWKDKSAGKQPSVKSAEALGKSDESQSSGEGKS
ncbi:apolipoprotein O, a isoform X1 [Amia ocellicauda]|uniref:apolipoprotein O, a isoform X1 n=1 Tax=Amia ocellicauda TaxID=2972642 RepID=UPI003464274A